MELPNNLITILIPLFVIIGHVSSQTEPNHINQYCIDDAGNYTTASTYQNNLNLLLSSLTTLASLSLFNNHTVEEGVDQTYGLYMCRGDSNPEECGACVKAASTKIVENCTTQKEAVVWYEKCMVRYANRNIFSVDEVWPVAYRWRKQNVSDHQQFSQLLSDTVNGLIPQGAYNTSNRGFAVAETNVSIFENLYVLIQCTPDILGAPCERCLKAALRNIATCCDGLPIWTLMYLPSCWLHYSNTPFVRESEIPPVSPSPSLFPPPSRLPPSPPLSFDESGSSNTAHETPPSGGSSAAAMTACGISFLFGLMLAISTPFTIDL